MKKEVKDKIYFLVAIFVVISVSLLVGPNTTGAAISIQDYGISDVLIKGEIGKMQTLISLEQPFLATLDTKESRVQLAEEIIASTDFPKGIVNLHLANRLMPVPSTEISKIEKAAKNEPANFQKDLTCLENIGLNHGHVMQRDFVLVSELKYQPCSNAKDSYFAFVKHSFFKDDSRRFVCSQDSNKLFLAKKDTGFVNVDVSSC